MAATTPLGQTSGLLPQINRAERTEEKIEAQDKVEEEGAGAGAELVEEGF